MKGAFVILTHKYSPITEGLDKGKIQVHETCEFVDAVKNKHLSNATIIMDSINRKLIKNRAKEQGATYEDMEKHMAKGYGDKFKRFLEIVGAEIPEDLFEKKEEEAPKKKTKKKKAKKEE